MALLHGAPAASRRPPITVVTVAALVGLTALIAIAWSMRGEKLSQGAQLVLNLQHGNDSWVDQPLTATAVAEGGSEEAAAQQQRVQELEDQLAQLQNELAAAESRAVQAEEQVLKEQQQQQQEQLAKQPAEKPAGDSPFPSAAEAFQGQYLQHGYEPSLPELWLQKGIVSYGTTARTRRLLNKLLQGEDTHVVVVGGSITWGQGATEHGVKDWGAILGNWVKGSFRGNITYTNRAIPATPSSYMSLCLQHHVPRDADLVVVEYNINDGGEKYDTPVRRAHERLLRKLLAYPNRPAVMELVIHRWAPPNEFTSMETEGPYITYRYAGDDELGVLAQYYHTPWFSSRSLMWDDFSANSTEVHPNWMQGPDHPNDAGHRYMADMVIGYLRRMVDDLVLHPYSAADEEVAQEPLPRPMFRGNYPVQQNTCLMTDEFKGLMVEHKGFDWVNDGDEFKPKLGWAGTVPGSTLVFEFNTVIAAEGQNVTEDVPTAVVLVYLRSYEHMGSAEVTCVSGCTCEPFKLEGHITEEYTQNHLAEAKMSPSKKCRVQVLVLNETLSGEHKVKINGIITSETQGQEDTGFAQHISLVMRADFGPDGGYHT